MTLQYFYQLPQTINMSSFFWKSCFTGKPKKKAGSSPAAISGSESKKPEDISFSLVGSNLHVFSMEELKVVTRGFSMTNFIGSGGFGPVYKGFLDEKVRTGLMRQTVAVKQLDLDGPQGHKEWMAEVTFLGQLRHSNLVKLIGYCFENENRLLVYEYMAKGSLENHLFNKVMNFLPWLTRLEIAVGAAEGLSFLHEAEHPVIYRDFKASNILLDMAYNAKLSDFGLARDGPQGDNTHVTTKVMGTVGYAAPEYIMTGHLTPKSDVYSFGVVLLELLTGRKSVDKTRPNREYNLIKWAKRQKLHQIMDPRLEAQYSSTGAQKAADLALKCLNPSPKLRPNMNSVVESLKAVLDLKDIPMGPFVYSVEELNIEDEKFEGRENDKRHNFGGRYRSRFSPGVINGDAKIYSVDTR